jgi:ABC-2 type transport system permease protein
MTAPYVIAIVAVAVIVRVAIFRARRARRAGSQPTPETPPRRRSGVTALTDRFGATGTIAMREITERLRGKLFRVGTLILMAVVAAAIVIPTLHHGSSTTTQTVGVVGPSTAQSDALLRAVGTANDDVVRIVPLASRAAAASELRANRIDVALIDATSLLLSEPASSSSSPADAGFVATVAGYLGSLRAAEASGISPEQYGKVFLAPALPVRTLVTGKKGSTQPVSIIGIVLLFVMLNQYDTWILIGVMQEKSSRVVEVLLAAVRPIQLLAGKVLGIGLVALGQAALIVGFALILAKGVGSDLLHGSSPNVLLSELLWLVLGYAFYCWVYAAAGSMAERQDQVQTLALPLSIPILVAYIFSLTVASTQHPDLLFKVLAYLPPTAPFCMSVLVALNAVSWWQFLASVLITIAGTVVMAFAAAGIYRRAVLRTGGRVGFRELFSHAA